MASRILNPGQPNVKAHSAPTPKGVAEKALQQSMFDGMEDPKAQKEYLELLMLKSKMRQADEREFGSEADTLRAIAGIRTPEEAMFLKIYAKLSKLNPRDGRMLRLQATFGNQSRMQLAKELAEKLIARRDAEQVVFDVLGQNDDDLKQESRDIYQMSMDASETNADPAMTTIDPARAIGFSADQEVANAVGRALRPRAIRN
jgi:hypothetical protein